MNDIIRRDDRRPRSRRSVGPSSPAAGHGTRGFASIPKGGIMNLLRRVVPVLPLLLLFGCAERHPAAPEPAPQEALFSRGECEPGPNDSCALLVIDQMVVRVDALEADGVLHRGQAQPLRNHLINAKRALVEGGRQAANAQLGAAEESVTRLMEDAVLTLEQASPLLEGLAEVLGKVLTGTIAFTSNRDGNHEIYLLNLESGLVTRLTNQDSADEDPAWSPDGTRIAFASNRRGDHDIWAMNADGSNLTRLTTTGVNRKPAWSPDGSRIAFARGPGVWVMNADGSNQAPVIGGAGEPAWSPDGGRLAFIRPIGAGKYGVWITNVDGPPQTQLLREGISPAWSPNGGRIALVAPGSGGGWDIWSVRPDGAFQKRLTNYPGVADIQPTWSSSGLQIAFARGTASSCCSLWVTSWWGSKPVSLNTAGWDPAWKP